MTPHVLFVIPVFNASAWLHESLGAILNQDWQSLSVLCIDDGSTDDSWTILETIASSDQRVEIRKQTNTGPGVIMNIGLAVARERNINYLGRMDADDLCDSNRTAKQVQFLESHPECAACGCGATYFINGQQQGLGKSPVHTEPTQIRRELLNGGRGLVQGATIFRTSALEQVNGWRPVHTPAEDIDLFLRLSDRYPLGNISDLSYHIRIHLDSYSLNNLFMTRLYNDYYIFLSKLRNAGKPEISFTEFQGTVHTLRIINIRRISASVGAYYTWLATRSYAHLAFAAILDPWRALNRLTKKFRRPRER